MSGYFGYNSYGANPAAYPQSYVAQQAAYVRSYETYQQNPAAAAAAYNAAAYRAMAQPAQNQYAAVAQATADPTKSYYYPAAAANGYDAAVYSAASSIIQAAPSQGKWTTPPSAAAFNTIARAQPKTPFKRRNPGAPTQLFYCEVCKISCAGPQTYKEHLEGQKHKKREQASKASQSNPTPTIINKGGQSIIRCELCDVSCTGRDAYAAHVRGTKHQKTVKLHQKLGKPIPAEVSLTSPSTNSVSKSTVGAVTISAPPVINQNAVAANQKAKLAAAKSGSALKTLTEDNSQSSIDANLSSTDANMDHIDSDGDVDVEPVGREYIEMIPEGKIITFHCKLCDCKFNDPNAKDMHLKGRRHRLAYKKKVDPNLKVDVKSIRKNLTKSRRDKQKEKIRIRPDDRMRQQFTDRIMMAFAQSSRRGDTNDDRHVMAKHTAIYPTPEEITAIQDLVTSCEKGLKLASDEIAEQDAAVTGVKAEPTKTEPTAVQNPDTQEQKQSESDDNQTFRALKGVMRVGLLAKGLLLKGDNEVQLVVLCSDKPTKTLLNRVYQSLTTKLESVTQIKYQTAKDSTRECICVKTISDPIILCRIYLTSPAVRDDFEQQTEQGANTANLATNSGTSINTTSAADLLDKQKCLESLAALRHAKWFQAKATLIQNCVVIIRILRDLCRRNPTWFALSQWALELLVEKSLSCSNQLLSPGEALRRVLECISSGILLPGGPGLLDPCEKNPVDAAENLKNQQREEITASAQMALRLLAFKQIHKILGMDQLMHLNPRKRLRDSSENDGECDEKKEKKDDLNPKVTNSTPLMSVPIINTNAPITQVPKPLFQK